MKDSRSFFDVEESDDDLAQKANEALAQGQREEKRLASRPDLEHLHDAVVTTVIDGESTLVFVPEVGERVVIERQTTMFKTPKWLDTRVWVVNNVNEETGKVDLWCEELMQNASCNYITGTRDGYKFKLPPAKGPIFRRKRDDSE